MATGVPKYRPVPKTPSHEPRFEVEHEMLALLPALRAYARFLTRDSGDADDLVQDVLARAIAGIDRFEPGTNLKAWLFTIARNTFFTAWNRRMRERRLFTPAQIETAAGRASQGWSLSARRVAAALDALSADQKDVLLRVCGAGFSYEEAAEQSGCAVGTIKSRINRGRQRLASLLQIETVEDLAVDGAGIPPRPLPPDDH